MNQRLFFFLVANLAVGSLGCFDVFSDPLLVRQTGQDGLVSTGGTGGAGGTGGTTASSSSTDTSTGGGGTGGGLNCVPGEENQVVEDDCGVFVSSSLGAPGGKGTKQEPLATLKEALAVSDGKPIYACGEILTEELKIEAGSVTLYGALDCTKGWSYDPAKKTTLTAEPNQVPVVVGKDASAAIFDVHIEAASATAEGGSSIAVIADSGATLDLERCEVVAGDGATGVTPAKPAGTGTPGGNGQDGQDGCVDGMSKVGGNAGQNMCDGMSYEGGVGGTGTTGSGGTGTDGQPQPGPMPLDGKGGVGQVGMNQCKAGEPGAQGAIGAPGDGAAGIGMLTGAGYVGVTGGAGKSKGSPGQGGGGGGGAKVCNTGSFAGPGGGGGGAGGCGGLPGLGGGAGGASIGIVSLNATVTMTGGSIRAGNGGKGGTGGDGQSGGKGGDGGQAGDDNNDDEASACDGGKGGRGGDGGPGGGGLGGHSLAIAFTGSAPVLTEVSLDIGMPGDGGPGGAMTMVPAAKGASGLACTSLSFDEGAASCVE